MAYLLDGNQVGFPDPSLAEDDGFLAVGGSLEPLWLLNAYYMGIFPWYDDEEGHPYWYSLDPRMVLLPTDFRCSKSLTRLLRSRRFEVRVDTCFREVMERCASVPRPGQSGSSWISRNFIDSYCRLHEEGFAHSFETFQDGQLVGGLYGVSLCDYFSGESMFHTVTDASKVAFAKLVEFAELHGFRFIDAQQPTRHLESLGAKPIPREEFLKLLESNDTQKSYRGRWKSNTVVLLIGGNQGDRIGLLVRAMIEIANRIGVVSLASSIYETEPWGFEAEQNFMNQALVVDTDLSAEEVLKEALAIEKDLGRVRPSEDKSPLSVLHSSFSVKKYSSRPMDIDLIFYNNAVIETPELQLPHPRMHLRRFVLKPLAQIIPDFKHPKLLKTISELLAECPDSSDVKEYF
ncbi:MAG: leucyl/phenylalanyl-tRNA--protein transferase [Bacteroidales bacterium]|nr:leucyl/phenylalanyl-tRNA--protein transferase [Bacteroidales bacterium]